MAENIEQQGKIIDNPMGGIVDTAVTDTADAAFVRTMPDLITGHQKGPKVDYTPTEFAEAGGKDEDYSSYLENRENLVETTPALNDRAYDRKDLGRQLYTEESTTDRRALNTSGWDYAKQFGASAVTEVLTGVPIGLAYMANMGMTIRTALGNETEFTTGFLETVEKYKDQLDDNFVGEIYRHSEDVGLSLSGAFMAQHAASMASTISLMIPGFLMSKGISMVGKGARSLKLVKSAAKISKAMEAGGAINAGRTAVGLSRAQGKAAKLITKSLNSQRLATLSSTVLTASTSRITENMMEVSEAIEAVENELRQSTNPDTGKPYTDTEITAKKSQVGADVWRANAALILMDLWQANKLFKGVKISRKALTSAAADAAGMTAKKKLAKAAASVGGFVALDMGGEGFEEGWQFVASQEAQAKALQELEGSTFMERMARYTRDDEFHTSVMMGAMGGGAFGGFAKLTQIKNNKKITKNLREVAIEHQKDMIAFKGNMHLHGAVEEEQILHSATSHAILGSFGVYKADLESLAALTPEEIRELLESDGVAVTDKDVATYHKKAVSAVGMAVEAEQAYRFVADDLRISAENKPFVMGAVSSLIRSRVGIPRVQEAMQEINDAVVTEAKEMYSDSAVAEALANFLNVRTLLGASYVVDGQSATLEAKSSKLNSAAAELDKAVQTAEENNDGVDYTKLKTHDGLSEVASGMKSTNNKEYIDAYSQERSYREEIAIAKVVEKLMDGGNMKMLDTYLDVIREDSEKKAQKVKSSEDTAKAKKAAAKTRKEEVVERDIPAENKPAEGEFDSRSHSDIMDRRLNDNGTKVDRAKSTEVYDKLEGTFDTNDQLADWVEAGRTYNVGGSTVYVTRVTRDGNNNALSFAYKDIKADLEFTEEEHIVAANKYVIPGTTLVVGDTVTVVGTSSEILYRILGHEDGKNITVGLLDDIGQIRVFASPDSLVYQDPDAKGAAKIISDEAAKGEAVLKKEKKVRDKIDKAVAEGADPRLKELAPNVASALLWWEGLSKAKKAAASVKSNKYALLQEAVQNGDLVNTEVKILGQTFNSPSLPDLAGTAEEYGNNNPVPELSDEELADKKSDEVVTPPSTANNTGEVVGDEIIPKGEVKKSGAEESKIKDAEEKLAAEQADNAAKSVLKTVVKTIKSVVNTFSDTVFGKTEREDGTTYNNNVFRTNSRKFSKFKITGRNGKNAQIMSEDLSMATGIVSSEVPVTFELGEQRHYGQGGVEERRSKAIIVRQGGKVINHITEAAGSIFTDVVELFTEGVGVIEGTLTGRTVTISGNLANSFDNNGIARTNKLRDLQKGHSAQFLPGGAIMLGVKLGQAANEQGIVFHDIDGNISPMELSPSVAATLTPGSTYMLLLDTEGKMVPVRLNMLQVKNISVDGVASLNTIQEAIEKNFAETREEDFVEGTFDIENILLQGSGINQIGTVKKEGGDVKTANYFMVYFSKDGPVINSAKKSEDGKIVSVTTKMFTSDGMLTKEARALLGDRFPTLTTEVLQDSVQVGKLVESGSIVTDIDTKYVWVHPTNSYTIGAAKSKPDTTVTTPKKSTSPTTTTKKEDDLKKQQKKRDDSTGVSPTGTSVSGVNAAESFERSIPSVFMGLLVKRKGKLTAAQLETAFAKNGITVDAIMEHYEHLSDSLKELLAPLAIQRGVYGGKDITPAAPVISTENKADQLQNEKNVIAARKQAIHDAIEAITIPEDATGIRSMAQGNKNNTNPINVAYGDSVVKAFGKLVTAPTGEVYGILKTAKGKLLLVDMITGNYVDTNLKVIRELTGYVEDGMLAINAKKDLESPSSITKAKDRVDSLSDKDIKYQKTDRVDSNDEANRSAVKAVADALAEKYGKTIVYVEDETSDISGVNNKGEITINLAKASPDTLLHEIVGHPLVSEMKKNRPELYKSLVDEMLNGPSRELYEALPDGIGVEESLVQILSALATDKMLAKDRGTLGKLLDYIAEFFKELFSLNDISYNATLSDVSDLMATKKFVMGVSADMRYNEAYSQEVNDTINSIQDLDKSLQKRIIDHAETLGIIIKCK